MSALILLAERCERAPGPNRELDCAIAKAVGWRTEIFGQAGHVWLNPQGKREAIPPEFTASLDAAVALVPEGKRFSCGQGFSSYGPWARIEPDSDCRVGSPTSKQGVFNRYVATVVLAVCAVALKARAAQ